ncbi:MAG TPA: hypothetical protein VLM91_21485 [Candidatus Methylomirabilis sp.]|nr:hypothetical protein [Candidatus Methylomirabilis sp.]
MARLGDPDAPFGFKRGDRVAWIRFDGSLDPDFAGQIVDGICEYLPADGIHTSAYLVRRSDGSYFVADQRNLMRIAPRE